MGPLRGRRGPLGSRSSALPSGGLTIASAGAAADGTTFNLVRRRCRKPPRRPRSACCWPWAWAAWSIAAKRKKTIAEGFRLNRS